MGRVEMRMYKRRRKRARVLRIGILILLLGAAVLIAWGRMPRNLITERIGSPTPTPVTSAFDKTVQTREVTLAAETGYAIQTGGFSR